MDVIINLNKPSGITSHDAVTRVKRLLGARKAGHTGTLDPMATGVLLICLNEATKISRFLLGMDKKYRARVKLGERTDTHDSQGRVIERKDISSVTENSITRTVEMFKGCIKQKPPMYSAVKINGETLYKLARKGIEIDRPERAVEIYDIAVLGIDLPYFDLTISCSKGTYIRTLCDDIGTGLGTGAHLVSLERTGIGFFSIEKSVIFDDLGKDKKNFSPLEEFFHQGSGNRERTFPTEGAFYSIDTAIAGLKEIFLDEADYKKAKNGVPIIFNKTNELSNDESVRLKGPLGNLFGIGRVYADMIRIERILHL